MKTFKRNTCLMVLMVAGPAYLSAFAADTVYQRSGNTQSIELSNIDDADTAQVPVVVDSRPARAAATVAAAQPGPAAGPAPLRNKRSALARAQGNGNNTGEEEEMAGSIEPEMIADNAKDSAPAASVASLAYAGNDNTVSSVAAYGGPGVVAGLSGVPALNPASSGIPSGPSGALSSNPTSPGTTASGTPSTLPVDSTVTSTTKPRNDTVGSSTTTTAGLSTSLQQYRQLMLQDAANPSLLLGNPATSRRYVMVDRTTYQTRLGQ